MKYITKVINTDNACPLPKPDHHRLMPIRVKIGFIIHTSKLIFDCGFLIVKFIEQVIIASF